LEEAQRNLCWFDGTPCTERVMIMEKQKEEQNKKRNEGTVK